MEVSNADAQEKRAYVRLFLLLVTDDKGGPVDPTTQQRFSIEMDRFEATRTS